MATQIVTRARANCKVCPQSHDNDKSQSSHLLQSHKSLPVTGRQSNFGLIPGHEIVHVGARLVGIERDEKHCVYRMMVHTGNVEFSLQKQFSDFRQLRDRLMLVGKALGEFSSECQTGACRELAYHLRKFNFPRRRFRDIMSGSEDVRTAMKRQAQLQHFLDVVLLVYRMAPKRQIRRCVNSQCHILHGINNNNISHWKAISYQTSNEHVIFDAKPTAVDHLTPCSTKSN